MDGVYPENDADVVTTGGSGFGIAGLLVGIDRGFVTREEGVQRLQKIADYLAKADRFHGVAWPHWMIGPTGKVKPFGTKDNGGDLVESSFLMQGLLCVRQYFKEGNENEKALASKIGHVVARNGVELVSERTGCIVLALVAGLCLGDEFPVGRIQRMFDYLYSCRLFVYPSHTRFRLPQRVGS